MERRDSLFGRVARLVLLSFFSIGLAGCTAESPTEGAMAGDSATDEAEVPTNRVPIPNEVRRNLGITFARAEYRAVGETVTLPGHFEVLPSAQHHCPAPTEGRVTVHVSPLESVEAGQLLVEIDSPAWRELQTRLVDARSTATTLEAKLARVRAVRRAAGELAPEKRDAGPDDPAPDVYAAEVAAAEAELAACRDRFAQLLAQASTLTGLDVTELRQESEAGPKWHTLARVPMRASTAAVVREVESSTGTWVERGTEILHLVQPDVLRFRARALQSDLLDRVRDGQVARVVPPEGRGEVRRENALIGTVRIGITGDPHRRTTDVFIDFEPAGDADRPHWFRPEVAAVAEVVVAGDPSREELAIPARAVIRDGLEWVFFRRLPSDPDIVVRTNADKGVSDGRWTTIHSGLVEGNEVVVDGIYPLLLATSGQSRQKGGHFHADGTWHEEDH